MCVSGFPTQASTHFSKSNILKLETMTEAKKNLINKIQNLSQDVADFLETEAEAEAEFSYDKEREIEQLFIKIEKLIINEK
jgi:flagellar biosynthesis/type III secretory pathway chaperone